MPDVIFVEPNGERHCVSAPNGASLMIVARMNKLPIKGSYGGKLACATCHVIVDSTWFPRLQPASESEERLLDVVAGAMKTSRLCCQIRMCAEFNGLTVRLPPDQTGRDDTTS